tara:strand:+ start:240 stop:665 length:426 start_codon:yes stop_codon:yes gene_type:complete
MAKAIDQAIYTQLISDQTAGSAFDLVSGRISASYGDPGEDFPLITFEQVGAEVQKVFGGLEMLHRTQYEVSIFGRWEDGLAELGDIADKVIELFGTPVTGTGTNFDGILMECSSGALIARDDELIVATISVSARGVQTGGL